MNLGGQEDCNNFDEGGNKNDHGDNRVVKQLAIAFSLDCQTIRYVHCVRGVAETGGGDEIVGVAIAGEGIAGCAFVILYVVLI